MSIQQALRCLALATVGGILIGAAVTGLAVMAAPALCASGKLFLHWMQGTG